MKTKKIFFIVLFLSFFLSFYNFVLAVDDSATANVTCNTGPTGYVTSPCTQEGGSNICKPFIPSGQVASVKFGCLDDSHFSAEQILNPGGFVGCNTTVFGDPYGGVVKACFYKLISSPVISSFVATPSTSCFNSGSTGSITFSWGATNSPTSYTLTQTSPSTTTLYTGTNTSYTQTGINPGTAYAFTLTATNQAGSTSSSTSVTVPLCSYNVTASAGTGCSISPSGSITKTSGTSQTFAITASSGYSISSVADNSINQGAISSYNLTNIQANHTIIATCSSSLYTLSVTKNPSSGGTVSSNPSGINCGSSCSSSFNYNTVVNLSATSNSGYVFNNWSGDCNTSGQVTMTANKSCTANFTARPDLIAGGVSPSGATINVSQSFTSPITNQGASSTGTSFPYFFQVASSSGGSGTITNKSSSTMSALVGSGGSSNASVSHTFTSSGIYSMRVCADYTSPSSGAQITESDESNNCGPWVDITVGNVPPPTPSNLQVTPSSCGNNWLNLSWSESTGATGYKVYRGGTLVSLSSFSCSAGTCSGSDTGLTLGSSYSYTIIASNTVGDSSSTSSVSAIVGGICTVTFNKNGGDTEANPITKTVNYGSSVQTLPTEPTRASYNFSSWNTLSGGTGTTFLASTLVTSNLTVYAIWSSVPVPSGTLTASPNPCSISLNASTCTTSLTLNVTNPTGGAQTNITKPTNIEVISNSTIANTFPKTVSGISVSYPSTTFYLNHNTNTLAQATVSANCSSGGWDPSVSACKQYIITFNKNGGTTEASPITKTVNYGSSVGTLPTPPTRTGYTFNGWNDLADGTGTSFTATTLVYASKTVYAQWIVTPVTTPPTPTGLQVTQDSCSAPSLTVSWNVSTGATSYKVYRDGTLISLSYSCNASTCSGIDSGLVFGNIYSYTIKASNSIGDSASTTAVSKSLNNCVCPSVTTSAIISTSQTTATGGGNVTSDGGSTVTDRGIVWGVAPSPNVSLNSKTSDGTGTGVFTSNITGLSSGVTYYIRAYATNSAGTCYGSEVIYNSGSLSDLTASSLTPTTATANVVQNYSASISNIGSVSTGTSFSAFMQVATASNGGGTITDKTAKTISAINSGGVATFTDSHTFTSAGTPSLRVCADKTSSAGGGVITESDEDNNCGPWVNITVAVQAPNLIAGAITSNNIVGLGAAKTFIAPITNIGNFSTPASPSFRNYYFINNAASGGGSLVASGNTTPLTTSSFLPGASANATSASYTFPSTPATYSIRFKADYVTNVFNGVIAESNESDNYGPWTDIIVGNGPDLIASNPTTSPSVVTLNSPTTFSSTITNQGTATTGASFYNLFQVCPQLNGCSSPTQITPATSMTAKAVSATGIATKSYTFTSLGNYSIRACADKSSNINTGTIVELNENNNCSSWVTINPMVSGAGACSSPPTNYNCANGTSENNIYNPTSHIWSWDCVAATSTANCQQLENIDGECDLSGSSFCLSGEFKDKVDFSDHFEWTCEKINNGVSASCYLPKALIEVTLTATPNPVVEGKPVKLEWNSTGSCSNVNANFGTPPLSSSGEITVTPTAPSTTYTITCDGEPILGAPNSDTASIEVKVVKPIFIEG